MISFSKANPLYDLLNRSMLKPTQEVKKPRKKKFENNDEIIKVDLSKKPEVVEETEITKVDLTSPTVSKETTEQPIVEITEEVKVKLESPKQPDLPENIQKVVEFMKDTGGDLSDYMNLNRDFDSYEDDDLLRSFYKETKPHLDDEEINFLVQVSFDWNENLDEEKDVKRKKLALKEQVANAKSHLDGLKSKYYEDIKAGSKLTGEQQKAWEFFNRYKRESAEQTTVNKRQHKTFLNRTNELFNDKFIGFEYNVGEKKFRFNVKDKDSIKSNQSDINNFIGKFLNEKNEMSDADGYHKSLFTAMNPDAVANHFYEQGKADALKDSMAKSKNISMDPRQQHSGVVEAGGIKVRVLGENSNDFKFKIKQK